MINKTMAMIAMAVIAGTITSGTALAASSSDPFAQLQLAISNLQSQLNSVQNQVSHIQLTPGPQGPAGPTGATGPAGPQGPAGSGGGGSPEATPITQFLLVKGQLQGDFGGSAMEPLTGKSAIGVVAVGHAINSPIDLATGQLSGRTQHTPLVVITHIDKTTPLLYNSLTTNENLPTVELDYYKTDSMGHQTLYFKIQLTNARISSVQLINQNSADFPDIDKYGQYEQISFVYQKITWTWTDGGITAESDWITP